MTTTLPLLMKELAVVLKEFVDARTADLEQRVAALEAKPYVSYKGVWKADGTYRPGDAATHHGALWICRAETTGEPSKDFVAWQLAVKRGAA